MNAKLALAALSLLVANAYAAPPVRGGLEQIQTVVILYGENRSFDNLYGLFPGANGLAKAGPQNGTVQFDRDGSLLRSLPPVWKKQKGPPVADPRYPSALPNAPFRLDAPPIGLPLSQPTRDLVHRYYQNQMQIDGGRNDMFVAWSDAGALTMGHYDGSRLPMWKLARQYTLADNFFMGAFGGSFMNHIWLVCACAASDPNAPDSRRAKVGPDGRLLFQEGSPARAADGPPKLQDGEFTPDGYAVNTVSPPYQPSDVAPAPGGDPRFADASKGVLPPQSARTIGDTLSAKNVSWTWYAGGFNAALQDPKNIYDDEGPINFQPHHQPFNYFLRYAPGTPERAAHLKDGTDFFADIAAGSLPQVAFYKPQGHLNEHPGYADVLEGDMHLADIVRKLQASPQWQHMAIIVTYDENGGFWDHAAPPKADRWGPGTRIPAIIISPYAKRGHVDHTLYDTTSILKFLTRRFGLEPLPGVRAQMGDLSGAFAFRQPGKHKRSHRANVHRIPPARN
ncbi:MAG TPA: acid phosphatase [Telluria sp.]|nr:acid phosphatase [Telluria sp.]